LLDGFDERGSAKLRTLVALATVRADTFSSAAALAWATFCKFAEGFRSVRSPWRIVASLVAIIARCDSFKCLRLRLSETT
jgi:hypothetical protein